MKQLKLYIFVTALVAVCTTPKEYNVTYESEGCGKFEFNTVKNETVEYHFPDVELILKNTADMSLTPDQVDSLTVKRAYCRQSCETDKKALLEKQDVLHKFLNPAGKKAVTQGNKHLMQVGKLVNDIETARLTAVKNQWTCYLSAKELLNTAQKKILEERESYFDEWEEVVGDE